MWKTKSIAAFYHRAMASVLLAATLLLLLFVFVDLGTSQYLRLTNWRTFTPFGDSVWAMFFTMIGVLVLATILEIMCTELVSIFGNQAGTLKSAEVTLAIQSINT